MAAATVQLRRRVAGCRVALWTRSCVCVHHARASSTLPAQSPCLHTSGTLGTSAVLRPAPSLRRRVSGACCGARPLQGTAVAEQCACGMFRSALPAACTRLDRSCCGPGRSVSQSPCVGRGGVPCAFAALCKGLLCRACMHRVRSRAIVGDSHVDMLVPHGPVRTPFFFRASRSVPLSPLVPTPSCCRPLRHLHAQQPTALPC